MTLTSTTDTPRKHKPARFGSIGFIVAVAVLVLLFRRPILTLVRFAWDSTLYSHTPLIPILSGYLIWTNRKKIPEIGKPATALAALFSTAATALIGAYLAGRPFTTETSLAITLMALVFLIAAAVAWFLGSAILHFSTFPLFLLVFMLPLPTSWLAAVDAILQHGSAVAAYGMFKLTGMPFLYGDLVFRLPGVSLQIAPECSGIRSTLVLLITSLVAGQWFLRSTWTRAALAVLVIPLALLRNGFRVFTLGELCVHVSPRVLDSPIHHQGGPIFFALSLIPFVIVIWVFRRLEHRLSGRSENHPKPA